MGRNNRGPRTTINDNLTREVLDLLAFQKGRFQLESGHHGDTWLDLSVSA